MSHVFDQVVIISRFEAILDILFHEDQPKSKRNSIDLANFRYDLSEIHLTNLGGLLRNRNQNTTLHKILLDHC